MVAVSIAGLVRSAPADSREIAQNRESGATELGLSVMGFTIPRGKIVEIDILADPERPRQPGGPR